MRLVDFGQTALMWAALFGYDKCADLVIQAGADVNAADLDGLTALMEFNGHSKRTNLLLEAGADVNAVDGKHGRTAVMNSALFG